jgi:hypothetical protein
MARRAVPLYARRVLRLSFFARCGVSLALAAGCARAHDLGATSTTGSASASGAGGAGGSSSVASSGAGGSFTTGSTGTGGVDAGPPGPTELTIVNGINDYAAVRFCFLPGDAPWPAATSGLAFAASQVVAPISGPLPADVDVTPWVIAGDLGATAGKSCTEILALAAGSAPPVVAQPLAVIPKVVLDSHKSLLLVANGCLGGAGHDDPSAASACGMGYTSTSPTAGVALVAMSRVKDPAHISLQVVNATPTLAESDVQIKPNLMTAMETLVVGSLSQGAIGPTPPFASYTLPDLGPLDGVKIDTFLPGTSFMQSSVTLGAILTGSSVGPAAFVDGASLVLVAVGASPGLPTGGFWHAFTYAVVKAEPG